MSVCQCGKSTQELEKELILMKAKLKTTKILNDELQNTRWDLEDDLKRLQKEDKKLEHIANIYKAFLKYQDLLHKINQLEISIMQAEQKGDVKKIKELKPKLELLYKQAEEMEKQINKLLKEEKPDPPPTTIPGYYRERPV